MAVLSVWMCGVKCNSLLHSSNSKFGNVVQVNTVAANGKVVPYKEDLLAAENRTAIMQVQWVEVGTAKNGKLK